MKLEVEKDIEAENREPHSYTPKTSLGVKLLAIRDRIVASGAPLFSWEEIEREVAVRRGGSENNRI